ncbi:hypothetical protein GTP38_03100 [Duganella sp. FT94W]|uniref:Uncharacterized protein n=1 Tax=Duganella lactea TaxID=2692173 RepID=A0ABW9V1E8_9BURK|nr:hypothetical protein [Duganella lactea]MYM33328.1 hypothetical protein [Duganella lactea]
MTKALPNIVVIKKQSNEKEFLPALTQNLFFICCACFLEKTFATEPLHDRFLIGMQHGKIFPSELLGEATSLRKTNCYEKQGNDHVLSDWWPVGIFELAAGKLWLTGLAQFSGDVTMEDVYPGMKISASTTWLTGTFKTRMGFLCYLPPAKTIYALEQVLSVKQGITTGIFFLSGVAFELESFKRIRNRSVT